MTKSEKLFQMVEFIREDPRLTAADLARLCDVSERGVYRYLYTLSKAGFSIRFQNGGYKLLKECGDILAKADPEGAMSDMSELVELIPIARHAENRKDLVLWMADVFEELLGHATRDEVALGIGTIATESGFALRIQVGGGPARGIVQMEPDTAYDIFENFLRARKRRVLFHRLTKVWLELESVPFFVPSREELGRHLRFSDPFALAMMRLKYLRDPEPIPVELSDQARYYKRIYNTAGGQGSVAKFIRDWRSYGCGDLVDMCMSYMRV